MTVSRTGRALIPLLALSLMACSAPEASPDSVLVPAAEPVAQTTGTPVHGYRIVNRYPHDRQAYTQGLIWRDGFLYESTGLNGQSSVRKVVLETGEVVRRQDVEAAYFAEGLTDWNDALLQLTWQARRGFVYDVETFELRREFDLPGEGWGLTHDGQRLILSDGSDELHFLDPETFAVVESVPVRDGEAAIEFLNELEWIEGEVYANVWQQERIARIDPASGQVQSWIDLSGLRPGSTLGLTDGVLNGIAWDAEGRRLFVTGKLWPTIFEIELVPNGGEQP